MLKLFPESIISIATACIRAVAAILINALINIRVIKIRRASRVDGCTSETSSLLK